jgi:hypothetical protein
MVQSIKEAGRELREHVITCNVFKTPVLAGLHLQLTGLAVKKNTKNRSMLILMIISCLYFIIFCGNTCCYKLNTGVLNFLSYTNYINITASV